VLSNDPGFSTKTVVAHILQESDLIKCHMEGGEGPSALISLAGRCECSPLICTHCKCTGHIADFCISCGGKFAGHTLEEAHIAQCTALANNRTQSHTGASSTNNKTQSQNGLLSANIATNKTNEASRPPSPAPSTMVSATSSSTFMINGITYGPIPSTDSANLAMVPIVDPNFPFIAYHAEGGPPSHVSINWNEFSRPVNVNCDDNILSAYSTSQLSRQQRHNSPFVLNSGASCHISPERSDFTMLNPIAPHPITGLGGSCVYATRVGSIELCTKSGKQVTLNRVLFVPNSTVHLISVFSVNNDRPHACYFDAVSCYILDSGGTIILKGHTWVQRRLYILDCTPQIITPNTTVNVMDTVSPSALYATRMPDLETWHRRLGHCSTHTIIDMVHQGAVEGMPINLSSALATCDHCILGKQTRSHMPKMHEGHRATTQLERVFINLCGPMPCVLKYSHLYSMNVIDDFSSYVWSLPLKSKSEAMNVLRTWHRTVENQTGEKLKIIVTDNGELVSRTTAAWCTLHGIEHQQTAPYTSAQNGQAEWLHRTVLSKARTMQLSCNTPTTLWDKFCATSAYLTNFTALSSLNGKTPYKLWFGHKPSLSHLRKIGCRAFALIQTHNPKIFQRSTPCILIGYAPHAKAYHL